MNTNFRQLLNAGLNPCNATPFGTGKAFLKPAAAPIPHLGLRACFLREHPGIIRKTIEAIDLLWLTGERLSRAAVNNIDEAFHQACLDAGLSAQDYPLNLPEAGRRFVTRLMRTRVALLETEPVSTLRGVPTDIEQPVAPFETLSLRFPLKFSAPPKAPSKAQAPSSPLGITSPEPRTLVVRSRNGRKYVELGYVRYYLVEVDTPRDRTAQASQWNTENQRLRTKPVQALSPKLTPRKVDAGAASPWDRIFAGGPIATLRVDNDASHWSAELSALLREMQVQGPARASRFRNARVERIFQALDNARLSLHALPAASPRPATAKTGATVTPLRPPTFPRRPRSQD